MEQIIQEKIKSLGNEYPLLGWENEKKIAHRISEGLLFNLQTCYYSK